MPKPTKGAGQSSQTSNVRARLGIPETAAAMIQAIVREYHASWDPSRQTHDLGRAADALGCKRRTLERAIQDFPALKSAIEDARSGIAILT